MVRNLEKEADIRKAEIRRQSLHRRNTLAKELRLEYDRRITECVVSHPLFEQAEEIFCYVSFGTEVSTKEIMKAAWQKGKKVAVPKVLGRRYMEFFYIEDLNCLCPGQMRIPEPPMHMPRACGYAEFGKPPALMIMPGTAFDRRGGRIGYGGGFYDTYMGKYSGFHVIALSYNVQLEQEVPVEGHDFRPEYIITEKECIKC